MPHILWYPFSQLLPKHPYHPVLYPLYYFPIGNPQTTSISWIAIVVLPSVLGLPFKINTFNFSAISPSPFHFISLCFSAYTFYYIFYYISYSISILFSGCIFLFLLNRHHSFLSCFAPNIHSFSVSFLFLKILCIIWRQIFASQLQIVIFHFFDKCCQITKHRFCSNRKYYKEHNTFFCHTCNSEQIF